MESWLQKAAHFMELARRNFEMGAYDLACFLAQQSAELLLKAALVRETGARPMTHSLYETAKRLSMIKNVEIGEGVALCAKALEQHYVQLRNPDARVSDYKQWEAEHCLKCLEEIWRWTSGLK